MYKYFKSDLGVNLPICLNAIVKVTDTRNNAFLLLFSAPETNITSELFQQVRDTLLDAGQHGPVLIHCGDGRRVG